MHREGTTLHHPFKPMPAYGALNSSFTVNGVVHDPVTGLETGSGHDRFNQYVTWDGSDQLQLETGSGHDRLTGAGPNGFSEVEIHFATPLQENCANGTFLQENCANGTFLHEGQQGFSEVEVHFEYNVGSTSGPGGTSYFTNFAMPVGDFI